MYLLVDVRLLSLKEVVVLVIEGFSADVVYLALVAGSDRVPPAFFKSKFIYILKHNNHFVIDNSNLCKHY